MAKEYQPWQQQCLEFLQSLEFDENNVPKEKDYMRKFRDQVGSKLDKSFQKKAMQFTSFVVGNVVKAQGPQAGLALQLAFDEAALLNQLGPVISKQLDLAGQIEVKSSDETHEKDTTEKRNTATPGNPVVHFYRLEN